jgi:SulP family sulfate permease
MNKLLFTRATLTERPELPEEDAPGGAGKFAWRALVFRYVPALDSLRTYSLGAFRLDLVAGLTVATVAVPQAMAYATIAGLPPQYGLYTAIVMTAVGALFDSSRQLINGPTNAISIALLSALAPFIDPDRPELTISLAITMALLVGLIQTGITLLRLGDLSRFVSHGVIVGFTVGAAVLLVLDQFKNLLGLAQRGQAGDHFLKRFWLTLSQADGVHGWTLAVGAGTIALVLALRWLSGRVRVRLPEFLLTVIVMAALVWVCGLEGRGVKVVGNIPARLPSFGLPSVEWARVRDLAGSALAIALLGLLEALAMAKAIAARTGQKLDINQQCLSEGLANLAGSFFHSFPGSGSLTRSAINQQSGAVSQWSGVIAAAAVAATLLLFAPLAYHIPYAALAGILMVSAWRLIDRAQLLYHLRATRFDLGIVVVTAVSAVAVSVEFCILIGVFLSFVLYVPRAARVLVSELVLTPERVVRERMPSDTPCSRILIFNVEGELFFGSASQLEEELAGIDRRAQNGVRVVVLRLKRARNPDAVCLGLLEGFVKRLEGRGLVVILCGVRRDMIKALRNTGLTDHLGPQRVFREAAGTWSSTLDAVRYAYELVGTDVCPNCPRREEAVNGKEAWYYMI